MKQRTVDVSYRCVAKNHERIFTFGEQPPFNILTPTTMPQFREPYILKTSSYFYEAGERITAYCNFCHASVPMIRVGPQPE